ncbi:NGG1p interacting factor NIF3 [Bacteriovoracaceae bacterium]|nr:NGG1p interacting factor NIF3 [Bacteriovoracaceae bacterium]
MMLKLVFFVPIDSAEKVKEAVFSVGAGRLGNYSQCSFEVKGVGQFKPISGAKPAIGTLNQIERVDELRVEILCSSENILKSIEKLKISHPYEEVAYEVYKIEQY